MRAIGIDTDTWRRHAWRNRLQSLALLTALGGFLALLGWLLWGADGILMLVAAGLLGVVIHPGFSPRLVMRLYGAVPLGADKAPAVHRLLSQLSDRAGLGMGPELYYIPSGMLNAFTVGSSQRSAAIAVTDGLLRRLNLREIAGVLAHEISHVRNNDLWVMGLADTFSRTTSLLSLVGQLLLVVNLPLMLFSAVTINWFAILLLVLAPNLSALAQLALSRTREYDADLNAVRLTGDPEGLANALAKIEQAQGGWWERIVLPGRRVPDPSLLRTHPDTRERISRLMELRATFVTEDVLETDEARHNLGHPVRRLPRWHISGLWH